ncbi:MAG: hypothetical protein ACP5XB_11105 [Isosphaeraceae bacterium]
MNGDACPLTLRIRLREFLLLTTLISLIAAAFAIRARTAYQLAARHHALLTDPARLSANWWSDRIKDCERCLREILS